MSCVVSGETKNVVLYDGIPLSRNVLAFSRWYRDKLNSTRENKRKITFKMAINLYGDMMKHGYKWQVITQKLTDELRNKGLLNGEELQGSIPGVEKSIQQKDNGGAI